MLKVALVEDSSVCFSALFCTVAERFLSCFPGYAMKEQFPERVQFLFGLYFVNIYVHKHTDMPNNGSSYSAPTHTGIHAANILFSSCQETISELTLQLAGK